MWTDLRGRICTSRGRKGEIDAKTGNDVGRECEDEMTHGDGKHVSKDEFEKGS